MTSYQHISLVERANIKILKLQGMSHRAIGEMVGRSHTTIGRELKRNHQGHPDMAGYVPELADQLAQARESKSAQKERLKNDAIRDYVKAKLKLQWTPEQIAAVIGNDIKDAKISHEAIYQFIYADYREGIAYLAQSRKQRYPRKQSKKRRLPKIKNRVDIDQRPELINARREFGHWESDSVVCQSGKSALNVIIERVSRRVFISKTRDKTSESTKQAILNALVSLPPSSCLSITYDNGSENHCHEKINSALGTTSYFCKPYHSWEKGAVENMNGLIRRYIPKKTNLDTVTEEELKQIEYQLNHRPRKCLEFKTPASVFETNCSYVT